MAYTIDDQGNQIYVSNPNDVTYTGIERFITYTQSQVLSEAQFMSTRLFGGPIVYTDAVDPQIPIANNKPMGRMTAQTIMHNPNIISLCPCKVRYVKVSKSGNAVHTLITRALANDPVSDEEYLNTAFSTWDTDKLLFTAEPDYNKYMNYVNMIARVMAVMIGIGDRPVRLPQSDGTSAQLRASKTYRTMDWRQYQVGVDVSTDSIDNSVGITADDDMTEDEAREAANDITSTSAGGLFQSLATDFTKSILKHQGYIHFYAQNSSSYSEDNETSTRQSAIGSQIESLFNGNDYIKDFGFLAGMGSDDTNNLLSQVLNAGGQDLSDNGWGDLIKSAGSYLKGGHMVFPQMVDSSTYGKSISITVKLISPSGDPESVFMNVYLPLAHLMALSLPKQLSANAYTYPFLVKLFSKGWMNCEMGIITSFRVQRGGSDDTQWTLGKLATEADVTMDVTPLYSSLMISATSQPFGFFKNDGLQEYLGTICGVNMKGDVGLLKFNIATTLLRGFVVDIKANVVTAFQQWLSTKLSGLYQMP